MSPNPWKTQTEISFELPKSGKVKLSIKNSSGMLIHSNEQYFDAGAQSFIVDNRMVSMTGILFYDIQFEDKVINRKMIKIE